MLGFLKRALGLGVPENRRQFQRYPIETPLEVTVGDALHQCVIENVSAGGLRLTPVLDVPVGEKVSIHHPKSGLSLDATVMGHHDDGTRVKFESDDAGTVVSVWVRMLHEGA